MNTYVSLDDDTQTFYNKTLLVRALPELVHDKFGQQKPIKTNSTRKQTFRRFSAFAINTTPLIEGVTPLGKDMAKTDITCTLAQYGDFTQVSDVATWVSRDKVLTEAAEILGEQGGQSVDAVWRDILVAGTSVACHEGSDVYGTTRTNVDGLMTSVGLRRSIRLLKGQNVKMFTKMIKASTGVGTSPIRPSFWMIIHTDTEYDFEEITGFKAVTEYAAQQNVMESEVGAFRNLRAVTSTQAKVFPDAGANVTSGHKTTTGTKEDVYATLIFGMNAYGIVPLSGHSMENIVKPLGSGGSTDPLNQRATSGWKAMTTAVILNDAFMTRLETGVTA